MRWTTVKDIWQECETSIDADKVIGVSPRRPDRAGKYAGKAWCILSFIGTVRRMLVLGERDAILAQLSAAECQTCHTCHHLSPSD